MFGRKKKGKARVPVLARLNDRAQPLHRGDLFEDPLNEVLVREELGEVAGGGTQLGEDGEVEFCDIEIHLQDEEEATLRRVIAALEQLDAPKGSRLLLEGGKEVPFGRTEGLAVYLNGTELPAHVYQECDVNRVVAEFHRLLENIGRLHSYWQGPTETAIYAYGRSFHEMEAALSEFLQSYPLCQKARIVQVA